jgi:DNA-directed RNA polymerase specialized sigma24 family protein
MITLLEDNLINDVLRMGWLTRDSAVSRVICPDLVEKARAEEWEPQRFVREAIPRIPMWGSSKLNINGHLLEHTCQNFVVRMITRRPDLFYDASKAPFAAYLAGLLWKVYRETCREERFVRHEEWVKDQEDSRQGPLETIIEGEDDQALERARKIVHQLIAALPAHQRDAVAQKYCERNVPKFPSEIAESVIRVWRCRGLRAIREKAQCLGLGMRKSNGARGRMRRSRRKPRGRALPLRRRRAPIQLRNSTIYGTVTEGQSENIEMSGKQQAIEADNARALQIIFDSLPESLKERVDVLVAVRERFEKEFARHVKRTPHTKGVAKVPPSS